MRDHFDIGLLYKSVSQDQTGCSERLIDSNNKEHISISQSIDQNAIQSALQVTWYKKKPKKQKKQTNRYWISEQIHTKRSIEYDQFKQSEIYSEG